MIEINQIVRFPADNYLWIIIKRRSSINLDESILLTEGGLGNIVEECKVELAAYECIGLDVMVKRSLIRIRNRVGDKTQPCGTLLLIGWGRETYPSTIIQRDLLER